MSMIHISSLDDAQRKWGPLIYNDLETAKKLGGDRPDWTDGDEFVRWAGEEYWIETEEEVKVECVICNTQTSNELDYDYDDDTGFHCCQKTDCLRQFYRG